MCAFMSSFMPSPSLHVACEREILAQGRCVTVRDGTEKQGCSLVEGVSRAVARMNQRDIVQAQIVTSNNPTPIRRKTLQFESQSA